MVEKEVIEQQNKVSNNQVDYLAAIYHTIEESDIPILVYFVEGICNIPEKMSHVQKTLKQRVAEYNKNEVRVRLIEVCIHEERLPFPQPKSNLIYFFAPKIPHVLFTRPAHWCLENSFERDINGIYKMMEDRDLPLHEAIMSPEDLEALKQSEEILKEEEEKEKGYPSFFQMARNATKDAIKSAKRTGYGFPVIVPDEVALERYSICQTCPEFNKETSRCYECGCNMKLKSNVAASSCPLGKWDEYNG